MAEFDIQGDIIIAGSRILVPISMASILPGVIMTVQGTVTSSGVGSSGTVVVATIQNAPLVTVQGTVTSSGGSTSGTVTVATILNAPLVTVQGTVAGSATVVYLGGGTVTHVGTILNAPLVTVQGTLLSTGTITTQQVYAQATVQANAVVSASGAATVVAQALQDLVVDTVYGSVVSGSILTSVVGVEPQSGVQTSTIVNGDWFGGTVQTGQRLMAVGPLGGKVAVVWTVAMGGTVGVGTIVGVYITAESSTTR